MERYDVPRPAGNLDHLTRVGRWKIPVVAPPIAEPAPPQPQTGPGEFTRMFQAGAPPAPTPEPAPPTPPAPPQPQAGPGEFTRMFQAGAPPAPIREPAPPPRPAPPQPQAGPRRVHTDVPGRRTACAHARACATAAASPAASAGGPRRVHANVPGRRSPRAHARACAPLPRSRRATAGGPGEFADVPSRCTAAYCRACSAATASPLQPQAAPASLRECSRPAHRLRLLPSLCCAAASRVETANGSRRVHTLLRFAASGPRARAPDAFPRASGSTCLCACAATRVLCAPRRVHGHIRQERCRRAASGAADGTDRAAGSRAIRGPR